MHINVLFFCLPSRLDIQHVFQQDDSDILYAVGFLDSLQFVVYRISAKNGEVLKETKKSFPGGFYGNMLLVSRDILVALDASRSIIVVINFATGDSVSFHQTYISDIVPEFSGIAETVPSKLTGLFALRTDACMVLLRVSRMGELVVENTFIHPTIISDTLSITEENEVFAVVQHTETKVHIAVRFVNGLTSDAHKETVELDPLKGSVQKVFINNYVKLDRSNGFRSLLVMEDHSLLLVQQGKIVWSREDGLASVVDSTTSELPVEKDGVSVAKVEHSLFEWLKVDYFVMNSAFN